MDFHSILSSPIRLQEINLVRDEILHQPQRFYEVFDLIFVENSKSSWRAAWAIEKVVEKDASFLPENETSRLMDFSLKTSKGGLQRSILAILINLPIPDNLPVEFINACFDRMISTKEPVAVQALSMKMLQRIAEKEPDFIPEILVSLENMDLTGFSAGYNAIRKNTMNALAKKVKL